MGNLLLDFMAVALTLMILIFVLNHHSYRIRNLETFVFAEKDNVVESTIKTKKEQDLEMLRHLRYAQNGCHERDELKRWDRCNNFKKDCFKCWISKLEQDTV